MKRSAILAYGVLCYAIFLATFVYAVGFLANVGVPRSIDSGPTTAWPLALAINLSLLGVFALQHSVMARPFFKRRITRVIPEAAERSTYVLASCLAFALLFWGWQPLPATVFSLADPTARGLATGAYLGGVALVLYATFLIDHFELFGLRQVVLNFLGRPAEPKGFVTPSLYRHVRHPLYLGWFATFWATPDMTVGHLLMALGTTGYILVAVVFEERDLVDELGAAYRQYQARTPRFFPRLRERNPSVEQARSAG